MRPIVVTVGPLASAVANNIALSQSPSGAGNVTLNGSLVSGGVATLDKPRRVLVTSAADDSGVTFTLYGTNWLGGSISESFLGSVGATVASVLDYATVTRIAVSGATTGAITVGTNGVAASPWARLDEYSFGPTGLQCVVTGTVSYTVEESFDDPNKLDSPVAVASMAWSSSTDTAVVSATGTKISTFTAAPLWTRVLLNSGTGSVRMTVAQSANAPAAF